MKKIVIAGGQNIGVSIFEYLLHNTNYEISFIIARTDDYLKTSSFPSLIKKANEHGVPVLVPADVNSQDVLDKLESEEVDIVVSAMYNKIFKSRLIELMNKRQGIVNIHYAPLPRYSGFWPEMWAIWNNERDFGVTFHYIDEGIDTGEIIHQEFFQIDEDETRCSLYEKCDNAAFHAFANNHRFLDQKVMATRQDHTQKTYCKKELPNKGIIDLDWDRKTIERYLRATSFYPYINAKIKVGKEIYSVVGKDLPSGTPLFREKI